MSWLYIGTFGSFIGYCAGLPLLISKQFPNVTLSIAFLGPLVGSLSRRLGDPLGYGLSASLTGAPQAALGAFIAFYGTCLLLAWRYYLRSSFATRTAPSLTTANV